MIEFAEYVYDMMGGFDVSDTTYKVKNVTELLELDCLKKYVNLDDCNWNINNKNYTFINWTKYRVSLDQEYSEIRFNLVAHYERIFDKTPYFHKVGLIHILEHLPELFDCTPARVGDMSIFQINKDKENTLKNGEIIDR